MLRLPLLALALSYLFASCVGMSKGHVFVAAEMYDEQIAVGDVVTVVDHVRPGEVMASARILADGMMKLPQLGLVPVVGKSMAELERELQESYRGLHSEGSRIEVTLDAGGPRYFVQGQVLRPGRFSLEDRDVNLFQAVMDAQPDPKYADLKVVRLLRPDDAGGHMDLTVSVRAMLRDGDTTRNVAIQDGDIIYVPPTGLGNIFSPVGPEPATAPNFRRLEAQPANSPH